MSTPTNVHLKVAIRVLMYLTRMSLLCYYVFLGDYLVYWKPEKQAIVSSSSIKAEYKSLDSTLAEFLWISYIIEEFENNHDSPISLFYDNKYAILVVKCWKIGLKVCVILSIYTVKVSKVSSGKT